MDWTWVKHPSNVLPDTPKGELMALIDASVMLMSVVSDVMGSIQTCHLIFIRKLNSPQIFTTKLHIRTVLLGS